MKTDTLHALSKQRSGWLDLNDVERLEIIRAEIDDPLAEEGGRERRLRKAQPEILDIIGPALDRMHTDATEMVEGGIALQVLTGQQVGDDEKQCLAAANQITNTLRDIRTGARVVEIDDVISGEFLTSTP